MKKGMTITLTVLMVLGLALGVTAATTSHTFFNVVDPDITISAFKHRTSSTSGYGEDALAQFTLSGTGTANGTILTSTDQYTTPWADPPGRATGNPNLWGGYDATGKTVRVAHATYEYIPGDFESAYTADTWCQWGGYSAGRYLDQHSLDVTGIPEGTLLVVSGDASTHLADSATANAAGQTFGGEESFAEAELAVVEGRRQVFYYSSPDWVNPTGWSGAYLNATAAGSSTVEFGGYTEGRYFHSTHHFGLAVPEMGQGGVNHGSQNQGFGYDIGINGSSLTGAFSSTYSYQNTLTETNRIRGEAGTWSGYPGDYPIYGDPMP